MSYYCCSSCDKKIELKYEKDHLKSQLHMNIAGTVSNKYTIMILKLCEINNILINNVSKHDKKFVPEEIVCKRKLLFDNDISINVKFTVLYRISVLHHNLLKYLKNKIKYYRRQGLEFPHITEININFITSLDFMTYKHYMAQPMPMVERIVNRRLYKKHEIIKTLDNIDLTSHMGPCENAREDVSDECK